VILDPQEVVEGLAEAGVKHVVTVPDSKFFQLLEALRKDSRFSLTIATNEGEGVAITSGIWLGGERAVMIMESTGLFVAANALERLGCTHGIPSLLLISHRGSIGDVFWWFTELAKRTTSLLDVLGVQYELVGNDSRIRETIRQAQRTAEAVKHPVALLFDGRIKWSNAMNV
jgi:sulfopyruvate decarboxylase subunit alpha